MSKRGWSPVSEDYFGHKIGNVQDPDSPNDPVQRKKDGLMGSEAHMNGRGSQGGGSKPTPQVRIMKQGSGALQGSYPRNTQKIRG